MWAFVVLIGLSEFAVSELLVTVFWFVVVGLFVVRCFGFVLLYIGVRVCLTLQGVVGMWIVWFGILRMGLTFCLDLWL